LVDPWCASASFLSHPSAKCALVPRSRATDSNWHPPTPACFSLKIRWHGLTWDRSFLLFLVLHDLFPQILEHGRFCSFICSPAMCKMCLKFTLCLQYHSLQLRGWFLILACFVQMIHKFFLYCAYEVPSINFFICGSYGSVLSHICNRRNIIQTSLSMLLYMCKQKNLVTQNIHLAFHNFVWTSMVCICHG
jgi:hypothetical protein